MKLRKTHPSGVSLPAGPFRFIAVDVETANSHAGSICQIGLAFVGEDNQIAVVSQLIDPQDDFDPFNIQIHGIRPQDVTGKPSFAAFYAEISELLKKNSLVQHSSFDSRAIRAACADADIDAPRLNWLDSVKIARRAWPEFKGNGGHGLANLKDALGLDFQHHDAGEDAKAAAMITLLAEKHTGQVFVDLAAKPKTQHQPAIKIDGNSAGHLYGQIAVFTGSLSLSRTEAAKIAAQAGITVKPNVSKKVTMLVVGDQDLALLAGHDKSSKHRRAEELIEQGNSIRIVGESEFLSLVRGI